jgi:hypothetical protein
MIIVAGDTGLAGTMSTGRFLRRYWLNFRPVRQYGREPSSLPHHGGTTYPVRSKMLQNALDRMAEMAVVTVDMRRVLRSGFPDPSKDAVIRGVYVLKLWLDGPSAPGRSG